METPQTRLAEVHAKIAAAARLAGRDPAAVTLIAVSKTHDAAAIRPLLAAGQRHFGENRVQEAQAKWPELLAEFPDTVLHLIGPLQSNKARDAARLFQFVHSVDRLSLVAALPAATACFVQVAIAAEPRKAGCPIPQLVDLLEQSAAAGLAVTGLMCLPPADLEPAPYFALLAKLARERGLTNLSMGMSGDYTTAIQLGATHIRVGTALFGARPSH